MITPNPIKTSVRLANRERTLRDIASVEQLAKSCFMCGESRPFALHSKEGHHIAGRRNDETLTGVVCLNCHAAIHETMRANGIPLRYDSPPNPLERLAALLASLGVLLTEVGTRLIEWSHLLSALITNIVNNPQALKIMNDSLKGCVTP